MHEKSQSRACRIKRALGGIFVSASIIGCGQFPAVAAEKNCSSPHARILQTVLSDSALRKYGNAYFDEKSIPIIWDDRPSDSAGCDANELTFSVTGSLGVDTGSNPRHIGVMTMYYDKDAAYVEIRLEPTGKNGQFFLRNNAGWKVTQRSLFETRQGGHAEWNTPRPSFLTVAG